ncbi:MAG: hypothetical protein ABWY55_04470 [Microbacterium sp.]
MSSVQLADAPILPIDVDGPGSPDRGQRPTRRARLWFWARRYGPAELGCLVTMVIASALAAQVTASPLLLAIAAIAGATVGFYGVLIVTVMREQLALLAPGHGRVRRAILRSIGLLIAEFGVAEILDTFFYRPLLMMAGVIVVGDAFWGLILGKVVSDIAFYVISGVSFRVTERTGIRLPRLRIRTAIG